MGREGGGETYDSRVLAVKAITGNVQPLRRISSVAANPSIMGMRRSFFAKKKIYIYINDIPLCIRNPNIDIQTKTYHQTNIEELIPHFHDAFDGFFTVGCCLYFKPDSR